MTGFNIPAGLISGDLKNNPDAYIPTEQDISTPLISGETAAGVLRSTTPLGPLLESIKGQKHGLSGAINGLIEGAGEVGAGFTTPESLALLPATGGGKIGERILAGVFEGQAIFGTKEQWHEFQAAENVADKTKIATSMGLGLLLPAMALKHSFKKGGAPRELTPDEHAELAPILEPMMRGGEEPPPLPEQPVVEAAPAPPEVAAPEVTAPEVAAPAKSLQEQLNEAQDAMRVAKASGDETQISEATSTLEKVITDYTAEKFGNKNAAVAEANANVTVNPEINPTREVSDATVFDPSDTEMAKKAAESAGFKYDQLTPEGAIQITDSETGSTFQMSPGETLADLKQRRVDFQAKDVEPAAKPKPKRSFELPYAPLGQPDIIDVVVENGGVKSKSGASKVQLERSGDLWDDQPDLRGVYRQLFGGNLLPDEMANIAAEHGFGDGTVGTMWKLLNSAAESRRGMRGAIKEQSKQQRISEKQGAAFEKDVVTPDTGKEPVDTTSLEIGVKLNVGGEEFRVTHFDPETLDITLEDGRKYGVQHVKLGQVLYVDKAELTPREQDLAPGESLPQLRAGENQGDLLSGQTEDLSLVGEKGTDFDAIQKRKAESEAALKRQDEEQQTRLFGEEGLSPGPGAAAAQEKLASYEERRFGKRFQETQNISPEIRAKTGNRFYEPISNITTVADARRIIQERGTDAAMRLLRDEAEPMEPRVRVTLGQALIRELNQGYEAAKAAGDVRHAEEFLNHAVDTTEFLSELGTTYGQGVQAFAIWSKLTPEGRLLEAQRIAEKANIELTPEQIDQINKLNTEIEAAPEGFQKDNKTQDLLSLISDIKGANPGDIPTALWYSNILSGFSTQLVNTLDTAMNVFSEASTLALAKPKAVPQILTGLYQGMIRGGFEAAGTLKTGRSMTGDKISPQRILERTKFGEKGGVPMNEDTALGRFLKKGFESKPAKVLNLWKYALRTMIASDSVFFNSMKEARARFLARGIAEKEGLSGAELYRRVESELNRSAPSLEAAKRQAATEGLTGLDQQRRIGEIIEQGRSDELNADTNEAAAIATYNHDPSGVLGLISHNIANITSGFPPGKFIVPFTRIVANVTNRGLNYTPWGYKRLFFGEWGGKKFATEPPAGDAYKAQLIKATLGTVGMATVAALDANGTIQVTAKGPDNPEERKQLLNAGWKPYSVKVGDHYYSYQYTPFQLGFAMIGHYRDAIRYNKLSEKDAATRLAYGTLKASSTIFDMSFLSGLSDFIDTIQGNTSSTKGVGRLFARTISSIAVPNIVKQLDKFFDPTIYRADSITQSLVRETPVARSLTLEPMLNVLGEPIRPSQNRFVGEATKDPVWKFITENQAWIPVPSKTAKIRNRPITPDEYYRLIKESGPAIKSYIQSNIGQLKGMTQEDAQKAIRKHAEQIRDNVKSGF